MAKSKNLTLCGQTVPFDGQPRLAEVEAYDAAIAQGGTVRQLVQAMAPAIINSRLRPEREWVMESTTIITQDCAVSVLEVVKAVLEALEGPKVKAALKAVMEVSLRARTGNA